jgi:predicted secreted protein
MRTVESGQSFDVELGSGPSAGYTWELPSLPEGLVLLGSDFVPGPSSEPGDGGVQVFHLRADRPGRFSLSFARRRRWESEPLETREIEIEAR